MAGQIVSSRRLNINFITILPPSVPSSLCRARRDKASPILTRHEPCRRPQSAAVSHFPPVQQPHNNRYWVPSRVEENAHRCTPEAQNARMHVQLMRQCNDSFANRSTRVVQGSAIRWALGCVNLPPAARGSLEAGITQPRAQLLADPSCTCFSFTPLVCTLNRYRASCHANMTSHSNRFLLFQRIRAKRSKK